MEAKVRRNIQFNDIEKFARFYMMYNDLFQTLNDRPIEDLKYNGSSFVGFDYSFVFYMSKTNFDLLKKNGIVRKISRARFKWDDMKNYKQDIWVLC